MIAKKKALYCSVVHQASDNDIIIIGRNDVGTGRMTSILIALAT